MLTTKPFYYRMLPLDIYGPQLHGFLMKDPRLHDFEIESLVEELAPRLQIIAEYNTETFTDLYVSDVVIEELGGHDDYEDQRQKIEDFLRMDFIDRHAYGNIVPRAGESDLFVTQAANVLLIRKFIDDDALFVSVTRNGSIGETIDMIETVLE